MRKIKRLSLSVCFFGLLFGGSSALLAQDTSVIFAVSAKKGAKEDFEKVVKGDPAFNKSKCSDFKPDAKLGANFFAPKADKKIARGFQTVFFRCSDPSAATYEAFGNASLKTSMEHEK
jgi:hypothetical protein